MISVYFCFLIINIHRQRNGVEFVAWYMYFTENVLNNVLHFPSALVWGSSVKHQPQKVGKDHVLADEDVVQIVKK